MCRFNSQLDAINVASWRVNRTLSSADMRRVKLMPKLFPQSEFTEHQALMVIYTLSGNSEALLREYYINGNSALNAQQLSIEEMAELLATTFYRGLFLENPPADKLSYTKNLQFMVRTPS